MARFVGSVDRVAAVAGLVAAGFFLAVPSRGVTPARATAPVVTDTPPVGSVWPSAKTFTMLAGLPDGRGYVPLAVLDDELSVGTLISTDGTEASLVRLTGGAVTPLQGAMST